MTCSRSGGTKPLTSPDVRVQPKTVLTASAWLALSSLLHYGMQNCVLDVRPQKDLTFLESTSGMSNARCGQYSIMEWVTLCEGMSRLGRVQVYSTGITLACEAERACSQGMISLNSPIAPTLKAIFREELAS